MLGSSDDAATDLLPIDTRVKFLVHQPTNRDIVATDKVEAMAYLRAWLRVVKWADDSFDCIIEDNVGKLVA